MRKNQYKKEYDNYQIIINKLARLLEDNELVLIKNTRGTSSLNSNRQKIEKVFGDLKCAELETYHELLELILYGDHLR